MTDKDACIARIRQRLESALTPDRLDIIDDSHKHAGHAGARHGGHFTVIVISPAFQNKGLLARHRMVYDAVGELMQAGIHALSIQAYTPLETPHKIIS